MSEKKKKTKRKRKKRTTRKIRLELAATMKSLTMVNW